jgi:ribosome biogenesis protein UTP30
MEGDSKVNLKQVKEAINAIVAVVAKKNEAENRLFDANTETVQLQFTLQSIPLKAKHKPVMIPLPNPLYTGRSVCVIVKDPQRTYKDLFEKHSPHPDYKVVGVGKLKTKYRRFEDRRQLCDAHDLFLVDSRVMDMMPQVLGKYFFTTKKKLPVPVSIAEKATNPEKPLVEAIGCTVLRTPAGPSCGVKIGRCDMTADQLFANAKKVLPAVFKHFAAEGNAPKQVHVQATDAVALQVFEASGPPQPAPTQASPKTSPKTSPKVSPKTSPKTSPKVTPTKRKAAEVVTVADLAKDLKARKVAKKK